MTTAWIQTCTGRPWYYESPRPEDVVLEDVAHALSNLCRFGGHVTRFYSVAEHSVLVSRLAADLLPPDQSRYVALQGLLHDATEAYVVDVPRPLKRLLPDYEKYEAIAWTAIHQAFNLPLTLSSFVHRADRHAVHLERTQLLVPTVHPRLRSEWGTGDPALKETPHWVWRLGLPPEEAKKLFMNRYEELTK